MSPDHILINPVRRLALGLAGGLIAAATLIAPHGALAAKPAAKCPPKLDCEHGKPTKLWYRISLKFDGGDTRTFEGGLPKFEYSAKWTLESKHAVLLSRVCRHKGRVGHPEVVKPGPCSQRSNAKRRVDDVAFSADAEGNMLRNESTRTLRYQDFFENYHGKDGRVHCDEPAVESVALNGAPDITGSIGTAAGSSDLDWTVDLPQSPDDATERTPFDSVSCTFKEYDPNTQTYKNPQPYTIAAGPPVDSYLTDLSRGRDAAYAPGAELEDILSFRFPRRKFGREYSKTWSIQRDRDDRPPLPPLIFDDKMTLTLDPCPMKGTDVGSC